MSLFSFPDTLLHFFIGFPDASVLTKYRFMRQKEPQCHRFCQSAIEEMVKHPSVPVSYTHLDVYKRQVHQGTIATNNIYKGMIIREESVVYAEESVSYTQLDVYKRQGHNTA